jgi:flagellar basal body rod protein FlgG
MIKSLETAKQGLLNQVSRNDIIANNLANSATTGFKREIARQTIEPTADDPNARELIVSSVTDHAMGSFRRTHNEFDLAIEHEGFFVVEKDGEEYFTRVGNFRLNETGEIATASGFVLQGSSGPIKIDIEEGQPTIAQDGSVKVEENAKGTVRVVRFDNPAALERAGANLFKAPEGQQPQDVEATEVSLLTGFIEDSNVNAIKEMVSMITALRAYQAIEKSVQSADETLDTMINRVGRVRGSG